MVTYESLEGVNDEGIVELLSVACAFTGVATNSPTDTGKWVLLHNNLPCPFIVFASHLTNKTGNIDPGRAGIPAWRDLIL
jgi:hypothetical protein